jgi:hypothetical protein
LEGKIGTPYYFENVEVDYFVFISEVFGERGMKGALKIMGL